MIFNKEKIKGCTSVLLFLFEIDCKIGCLARGKKESKKERKNERKKGRDMGSKI